MPRIAHILPTATCDPLQHSGYVHHSKILRCSLFGVPCSVFSSRTHRPSPEPNWYIYHSDHLGSSAFLTDASGDPTQHLQYMPFGENFIEQRSITSYYTPYTFSAKERDTETGYSYFGARYYDADISVWLSVDPMADKYPSMSAYMYCAGNPVRYIDPNGMEWVDSEGNKITDHSKIKVYIFYDPNSFSSQSKQMYKDAVAKYGEGSVAMSNVTTTAEFKKDWGDMASGDIKEVNLNYHGSPRTINLDYQNNQYLTSTDNGKTPLGTPATNISDLPTPSGSLMNAQLNINSCRSNDKSSIPENSKTVAQSFRDNTFFLIIRTTDKNVSYWNWFSPNRPHPQDHSPWQYLHRRAPDVYPGVGLPPK